MALVYTRDPVCILQYHAELTGTYRVAAVALAEIGLY